MVSYMFILNVSTGHRRSKIENGTSRRGVFQRKTRWRTGVGRRPSTGPAFPNVIQRNDAIRNPETGVSRRGTFERKTRWRAGVGRRPSTGPAFPNAIQRNKPSSYCTLNPLKCKRCSPLDLPQNGPFHIKLCLARAKSVAGFKTMV